MFVFVRPKLAESGVTKPTEKHNDAESGLTGAITMVSNGMQTTVTQIKKYQHVK